MSPDEVITIEADRWKIGRGYYTETVNVSISPDVYDAIDDWTNEVNQSQQLTEQVQIPSRWIYDDEGNVIGIASGSKEMSIEQNDLSLSKFNHQVYDANDIVNSDTCKWCNHFMVNSFTHSCNGRASKQQLQEYQAKVWKAPEIGVWE